MTNTSEKFVGKSSAGGILELKSAKLSEEEQAFIREYRDLEENEREKGIKFFRCVGDEPHTTEFEEGVQNRRSETHAADLSQKRSEDCNRFKTELDRDCVVVDTTL